MTLEKLFQILAVILIGVAAYFLWSGNSDGLFIAAVLGAVCFFLSVRFQVKERLEQRRAEDEEKQIEEETSDDSLLEEFSPADTINEEHRNPDKERINNSL